MSVKNLALIIMAFTITSCTAIKEYAEEQASKPRYEKVYRPVSGDYTPEITRQVYLVCSAEGKIFADQKVAQAKGQTTECHDTGGGFRCTHQPTEIPFYDYESQLIRADALETYIEGCMAKNGHLLREVCVKNCQYEE